MSEVTMCSDTTNQAQAWPEELLELAGAFADFPMIEDGQSLPNDLQKLIF